MISFQKQKSDVDCPCALRLARLLLIGYAVVLPFRGTASLQSISLLTAFAVLLWNQRASFRNVAKDAWWLLWPLLMFSAWVFLVCGFWRDIVIVPWNPGYGKLTQPWFSLDQWRRDIGQPMLSLLCGYWAFRGATARRWLFAAQALLLVALLIQCLKQFYVGELVPTETLVPDAIFKGTLFVRGFSRDNIFLSYVLLLLTPGLVLLVLERKVGWQGWLRWALLLVLLYLIFLNKRRGTWLALYVEFFLIAAWMGKRVWIAYFVGTLVMVAAAYQVRPHWFQRDYDSENSGRVQIWKDVGPLLLKNPVSGIGFGKQAVEKSYWHSMYQQSHNTFVNVALEVGFPGLALWVAALAAYASRFWKARGGGWAVRIGFALLVAFSVRNLTDDLWMSSNAELFWFLIGVLFPNREAK